MKLEERLANMSVNHKAQICNRLIRKVYTGTSDLKDLQFSTLVAEYDKNPEARVFLNWMFPDFGIQDMRKIFDFIPPIGLSINPMKCEGEIDSSIKYYVNRILNKEA